MMDKLLSGETNTPATHIRAPHPGGANNLRLTTKLMGLKLTG